VARDPYRNLPRCTTIYTGPSPRETFDTILARAATEYIRSSRGLSDAGGHGYPGEALRAAGPPGPHRLFDFYDDRKGKTCTP
jgi:hypothetical protein